METKISLISFTFVLVIISGYLLFFVEGEGWKFSLWMMGFACASLFVLNLELGKRGKAFWGSGIGASLFFLAAFITSFFF
jgi:hypothetical protein